MVYVKTIKTNSMPMAGSEQKAFVSSDFFFSFNLKVDGLAKDVAARGCI
jgi:hypothetical protein